MDRVIVPTQSQSDGKIVAAGSALNLIGPRNDFALARYTTAGTLDTSFGANGKITTAFDSDSRVNGLAIQSDGKVIAAGSVGGGGGEDFALARYLTGSAPVILTDKGTGRAAALDSVTWMRDPFPVVTTQNFSSDQRSRISLFAVNVQPGEPVSAVTAQAEDSQHNIYPLTVEYVGTVPGLDWLTQVVFKLPDTIMNVGDVSVSFNVRGVPSNKALIRITAP